MADTEQLITVRRRWNANETAKITAEVLWDFHLRNDAGGVCGAFPRAFEVFQGLRFRVGRLGRQAAAALARDVGPGKHTATGVTLLPAGSRRVHRRELRRIMTERC